MAHYDFEKDDVVGREGEQFAAEQLQAKGYKLISFNSDYRYDIKMEYKGKVVTFEVKTCVYRKHGVLVNTGNMAIEYKCRGKYSGISVTEADYFIYLQVVTNEMLICKVSDLKAYLKSSPDEYRKTTNSGDNGSKTHLCLIRRDVVKKKFFKSISVNLENLNKNSYIDSTTLNNDKINNMDQVYQNKFTIAGKLKKVGEIQEFASGFR